MPFVDSAGVQSGEILANFVLHFYPWPGIPLILIANVNPLRHLVYPEFDPVLVIIPVDMGVSTPISTKGNYKISPVLALAIATLASIRPK